MESLPLTPEESLLTGQWCVDGDSVRGDATAARIQFLIRDRLVKVATSVYGGWETLYRDPSDGRFWELTYPQGHLHGGGPPTLSFMTHGDAARKYDVVLQSNISLQRDRSR
jgi:Immunity protein 27